MPPTIVLLADAPEAIGAIARMRWLEWGQPPEPQDLESWREITRREAGRDDLPVTFVAREGDDVLGAVGLDHHDLDERQHVAPWITGMITRSDHRNEGVGRVLMAALESWAIDHDIVEAWVGTEHAASFYARCDWTPLEKFRRADGQWMHVLHKNFDRQSSSPRATD